MGFKIKPLPINQMMPGQRLSECSDEDSADSHDNIVSPDRVNFGGAGRAITRRSTLNGPELTDVTRRAARGNQLFRVDQDE